MLRLIIIQMCVYVHQTFSCKTIVQGYKNRSYERAFQGNDMCGVDSATCLVGDILWGVFLYLKPIYFHQGILPLVYRHLR